MGEKAVSWSLSRFLERSILLPVSLLTQCGDGREGDAAEPAEGYGSLPPTPQHGRVQQHVAQEALQGEQGARFRGFRSGAARDLHGENAGEIQG